MKPFPVPPGRNIASCFFSEQLLGTRHTVLQTGGRNKPEAPDACSDRVYILMEAWTVGSTGTNEVTGRLQINIMAAKLCCGKEDCHESNTQSYWKEAVLKGRPTWCHKQRPKQDAFLDSYAKKLGIYLTAILNCKFLKNKNIYFFSISVQLPWQQQSPSMAEVDWRGRCTGVSKGLSTFHT